MSLAGERIEHDGIVENITSDTIFVKIVSTSACASCQVKGSCSMSEAEDKILEIPNQGQDLRIGERVNLVMNSGTGLKSVVLAYILPVVVLVAGLIIFSNLFKSEGVAALLSLVAVAAYYLILSSQKKALERKFMVQIEKF